MRDKVPNIEKRPEAFAHEVYKSDWFKKTAGNRPGALIKQRLVEPASPLTHLGSFLGNLTTWFEVPTLLNQPPAETKSARDFNHHHKATKYTCKVPPHSVTQ